MSSYSKSDVVLVRYPFSDLSGSKIRPAVVVSAPHISKDIIIVPLTSKTSPLLAGEFVLADWSQVGLNVESAVKRGVYTVHESLVAQTIGQLSDADAAKLKASLRGWLERRKRDEGLTEIVLTRIYEKAEEGGYIGYIAELPGANTQGETMEEVRENLLEAMQMILEANREEAERRLSSDTKVTREPLTLHEA